MPVPASPISSVTFKSQSPNRYRYVKPEFPAQNERILNYNTVCPENLSQVHPQQDLRLRELPAACRSFAHARTSFTFKPSFSNSLRLPLQRPVSFRM